MHNIETVNKNFYDKLYAKKSMLHTVLPLISFDQQSKSKYNYNMIKPFFLLAKQRQRVLSFLDYGFGHGSLLLKIPQTDALYGCDISKEAVYNFPFVAHKYHKQVQTFTPEVMSTVLKSKTLDFVSLSHVIEHVVNEESFLNQLLQFLKSDGKFLINVPINEIWQDPKHVRTYTAESMAELLRKCGMKIDNLQEVDRWTSFLLTQEKINNPKKMKKLLLRALRAFLAVLPLSVVEFFEHFLCHTYKHQQLIILASFK